MPSQLPDGETGPSDGSLPASALTGFGAKGFGFYIHIPFCRVRCGYCDFNTYTAEELGPGVSRSTYADQVIDEIRLARTVLGATDKKIDTPLIDTVFFGGGTPTLLPPDDLARIVTVLRDAFGLADDAEVTTEANPDSVTAESLRHLREAGFTRLSMGMQSAVPHVLATLDRTHDPKRVPDAVRWAREAGFDDLSLDLIYGTPGESLDDWRRSLDAALACEPDHVSAYSLIVEEGTALARRIKRGELPMPDEDDLADKYVIVDETLRDAGFDWYEVSNWARHSVVDANGTHECRHNLLYWQGGDWWGAGPGALRHVGGVRWWNVKHPAAYADRLAQGLSPAHAREVLTAEDRRVERVLLELRLRSGLDLEVLDEAGREAAEAQVEAGLGTVHGSRLVLTDRGRLLADAVVRALLP